MREGWEEKRLEEFAHSISTGPFGSLLHKSDYVSDGVPLVNPINIVGDDIVPDGSKHVGSETMRRLDSYVLKEGDIVIARRGEIGRCAVITDSESGWLCGTGCFYIRPLATVNSVFLAHLLRSAEYREELERMSTGATMKNLSNKALCALRIPLPPLAEQKRIVAILDEAFAGIATAAANAEKNLANARQLFESHLNAVFEQKGEGWERVPLSALAAHITDGDHAPPPKAPEGVPFITISNIDKNSNVIDFTDTFAVPRAYYEGLKETRRPIQGDVLYTVTGSFGIPVIVDSSREFCFQRHIGLIRPKEETDSRWLYYALLSPAVRKQAADRATGTAQKTVSLAVLRSIEVPRMPLAQQLAVASELDVLSRETQRLEAIYQQKLAALAELKQSILQKAFSGDLTAAPERALEEAGL